MKKLGLLLILAALTGCRGGEENATVAPLKEESISPMVAEEVKQPITIDPFASTYHGNLPCSECKNSSIETILQLTNENRYFLTIKKVENNEERHFSGQYRISNDKRFIQLDDSADTLTFMLNGEHLEARLPDGTTGNRQFPNKNYQLQRQPDITPDMISETHIENV